MKALIGLVALAISTTASAATLDSKAVFYINVLYKAQMTPAVLKLVPDSNGERPVVTIQGVPQDASIGSDTLLENKFCGLDDNSRLDGRSVIDESSAPAGLVIHKDSFGNLSAVAIGSSSAGGFHYIIKTITGCGEE